jgi:hypothetical protein
MARAEAGAAEWVRANPNTTLEQRLTAGRFYAQRAFGQPSAGRPATPQAAAQGQAARLQALAAERDRLRAAGTPMSTATYNSRRNEIINGS